MMEDQVFTFDLPRPNYPFLPDHIPKEEPVSVHVLDGDETILFGTGYASAAPVLISHLDALGGPDVIIIEHGHPDHYDAVGILQYVYEGAIVAIPAEDAEVLTHIDVKPDYLLSGGDDHWGLRMIHVPGHTPGNMAFLHEESSTLFAGDTVAHKSSRNAAKGRWSGTLAPMTSVLNWNDQLARDNISMLSEYGFDDVRITHGPNVPSDGNTQLQFLLKDLQ